MTGFLARLLQSPGNHIDKRLEALFGYASMQACEVKTKHLPGYRYVDAYNAAEAFCKERESVERIETEHQEDLNTLLHSKRSEWDDRQIKRASRTAWPVSADDEIYLPGDCFWLVKGSGSSDRFVIRVRFVVYTQQSEIAVGCVDPSAGEECLQWLIQWSEEHSIYRNRVLQLSFEAGTKDEYGDVESPERLRVIFRPDETVGDDDIVMDEEILKILWRNVIDLHERRDILKRHNVPVRRGILLYGPPGTGKTYACRYLCGKLPNTTRIIVTGAALTQVGALFSLARLLQPSLLILEDVDLVFASREINLYSTGLGDLLDQMDGLRPYEDVGVVLTTNAIERLEAAIKDRPGRVSQCVFMGTPNTALRKRYLTRYLRDYETGALDIDAVVKTSDGASQAFLKEWVHRSVQIATERLDGDADTLELRDEDFSTAMEEMKSFLEGSAGQIIGFFRPS